MWQKAVAALGAKLDRIGAALERNADAAEKDAAGSLLRLEVAQLSMSMALTTLELQLQAAPIGTRSSYAWIFDEARELGILPKAECGEAAEKPTIIAGA